MNVKVENGYIVLNEEIIKTHIVQRQLPTGANGYVYLAKNVALDRLEVVKIWAKLKVSDKRDKHKQALLEAQKLARAQDECVVSIYSATTIQGHLVATMEYVDGLTLKDYIQGKTGSEIVGILTAYLAAIVRTSQKENFHGDAHASNVLIYNKIVDNYETVNAVKLCDFGTSAFSGKVFSHDRHWKVVKETVLKCTANLKGYAEGVQILENLSKVGEGVRGEMSRSIGSDDAFYDPRMYVAPFWDYLEFIEYSEAN